MDMSVYTVGKYTVNKQAIEEPALLRLMIANSL